MRVRFLRESVAGGTRIAAGQVVDLDPLAALRWLRTDAAEIVEVSEVQPDVPVDRPSGGRGSRREGRLKRPKPGA
jgi:hypothetical protein